jgi:hypothetical protein
MSVMHGRADADCAPPSHVKQRPCGHADAGTGRNCRRCNASAAAAYRRRVKIRKQAAEDIAFAAVVARAVAHHEDSRR